MALDSTSGEIAAIAAALGGGSGDSLVFPVLDFPGYGAGRRYFPTIRGAPTTGSAIVANKLYYVPFWCRASYTFTSICFEQAGAGTTGNARLGVYLGDNAGYPGTLQQDCGTVACPASTGIRTVTVSIPLVKARYWLAVVFDAAVNVAVIQAAVSQTNGAGALYSDFLDLGTTQFTSMDTAANYFPRSSHTYGALPSTAPAFESGGTSLSPVIALNT